MIKVLILYILSLMPSLAKNLLTKESSPYLKLHANQPVNWMPWGDLAFQKALEENKPILLSIGYSTCHWCHVMARESFEDHDIAEYLNEHFISIKLDREERPDIDSVYMAAHQAMNEGSGGWPLNIFLTPSLKPFFSGTYFPPKAKANRAGFDQVLRGVNQAWIDKSDQVSNFSQNLITQLSDTSNLEQENADLGKNFISHTMGLIRSSGDTQHFGWGRGPKFPQSSLVRFLLQSSNPEDRTFALDTCRKMAESGLYDQVNGGFHRYCVDQEWIVPHFEKMLYDQGQLIEVYLDAYLVSKDPFFAKIATETCDYIIRELTADNGTFFSAQDAQSENKEGKFCCWTLAELKETFSPTEVQLLEKHYNLTEEGNFYDFSNPEALKKQNVLVIKTPFSELISTEQEQIIKLKSSLFKIREERTPPATDEKVLLNWNALAIAALARTGNILNAPHYLEASKTAYSALLRTHKTGDNYHHSVKDDQKHGLNLGSDLSSLLYTTRILYHCTLETEYLDAYLTLSKLCIALYHDDEHGGFYETTEDAGLIMRMKSDFDQALPTVGSQMVRELKILSKITGNNEYTETLEKALAYYKPTLQTMPHSLGEMLLALSQTESENTLVLANHEEADVQPFIKVAHMTLLSPMVITPNKNLSKFYQSLPLPQSGVTAYYCEGKTCRQPTSSLEELAKNLSQH